MPSDREATRLIVPRRAVRFDEITVDKNPAYRKRFEATRINIPHRLLTTKIMQCPSRYYGIGDLLQLSGTTLIHKIGESHAKCQIAECFPSDIEEDLRKIESLVSDIVVALQNVARHVAGPRSQLNDVSPSLLQS